MNIDKKKTKITLFIQFILTIITIITTIIYIFNKDIIMFLQISLASSLFITGYNNHTIYKRKALTYIDFILGFLLVGLVIITILEI